MYQCPERGDLHFHEAIPDVRYKPSLCQCPKRGDLHFHTGKTGADTETGNVSMP